MTDHVVEEPPFRVTTGYYHLTGERIAWTREIVQDSVLVDLDRDGRVVGIETIGKGLDLDAAIKIIRAGRFDDV